MRGDDDDKPLLSFNALGRIQSVTGLAISGFTALHLANTASAWIGPHFYDEVQSILRIVYQNGAVELGLAVAVVLHGGASLLKMQRRRLSPAALASSSSIPFEDKVHRLAGLVLLSAVGVHVVATRVGPDFLWADRFGFFGKSALVAHSLQGWSKFFMFPYYSVFAFAGVAHTVTGVQRAVSFVRDERRVYAVDDGRPSVRQVLAYSALAVACALTVARFAQPSFLNPLARQTLIDTSLFNQVGKSLAGVWKKLPSFS